MTQIPEGNEQGLIFEIVSARIIDQEKEKKHVIYTLQIRRMTGHDDLSPSVIDRRYTDFLNLYSSLKKEFPLQMANIPFPRKALWGNFDNELISARSTEFESLLKYIASDSKLRSSNGLLYFLQDNEGVIAKHLINQEQFSQSLPYLENIFKLINKVFTDRSPGVIIALCRLLACSLKAGSEDSEKWADLAFYRFQGISDSDLLELYIPLLNTCRELSKNSGHKNDILTNVIDNFKKQGVKLKQEILSLEEIDLLEARLYKRD